MAAVATAPNDSSDDRSGTENKDSDDEDNEFIYKPNPVMSQNLFIFY